MMATSHSTGEVVFQFLLVATVGIAVIVAALRQRRNVETRSLDLQMLAERLKFDDFNPGRDERFVMGWGFLSQLARGEDRYAFNILRGDYHGQALFVFDYHYQIGSGKNQEDHLGTVLMLVVKEAFPQLTIGPENFQDKLAAAFGLGNEISFESAEFSRKFSVRSADKKFAYDVCNPKMMEYLLLNPYLQIEIHGPVISLAFEPQLPVSQIEFNLQRLAEIRSLMPDYLFTNA
jgi:hypothetical protein